MDLKYALYVYGGPVLMVLGTIGNVLAGLVVFKSKELWKHTMSRYLLIMAIVDTLTLNFHLITQLAACLGVSLQDQGSSSSKLCNFVWFWGHLLIEFEAWIFVNMSVERFFAVFFPLRARRWFTKKTACLGLLVTFGWLFLQRLIVVIISGTNPEVSFPFYIPNSLVNEYKNCLEPLHYIQRGSMGSVYSFLFIASLLPFLLLSTSSILITFKLVNRNKEMESTKMNINMVQMTINMLIISSVFLISTAPSRARDILYVKERFTDVEGIESINGIVNNIANRSGSSGNKSIYYFGEPMEKLDKFIDYLQSVNASLHDDLGADISVLTSTHQSYEVDKSFPLQECDQFVHQINMSHVSQSFESDLNEILDSFFGLWYPVLQDIAGTNRTLDCLHGGHRNAVNSGLYMCQFIQDVWRKAVELTTLMKYKTQIDSILQSKDFSNYHRNTWQIAYFIQYINFAINVYIYLLTSSVFRHKVKALIVKRCKFT